MSNIQKIDTVIERYYSIEQDKCAGVHSYRKEKDINILKEVAIDLIDDSIDFRRFIIGESFSPIKILRAKKEIKEGTFEESDIISFMNKLTNRNTSLMENSIMDLQRKYTIDPYNVIEGYVAISKSINESYIDCMIEDSDYIMNCLENMSIVTEADDKPKEGKLGSKVKKMGSGMVVRVKALLVKIKTMFIKKLKDLRDRDLKWLKENKEKILKSKVSDLEVNIHSDYSVKFSDIQQRANQYTNRFEKLSNYENSDRVLKLEETLKMYTDNDGELRNGLMNYYRTGKSKTPVKVITLRGEEIKKAIPSMYTYCIDFLSGYTTIEKSISELEREIGQLEKEMKTRNINESYSIIERDFYKNTDLALCENFHTVMEADGEGDKEEPKVGVVTRNETKEKTDGMSDKGVSGYNKVIRDKQLGLTTQMTVSEQKYFEYIKIIKGIM